MDGLPWFFDVGDNQPSSDQYPVYSKYNELKDLPFDYKKVFEEFFAGLGRQKSKTLEIKGFHNSLRAKKEIELALSV